MATSNMRQNSQNSATNQQQFNQPPRQEFNQANRPPFNAYNQQNQTNRQPNNFGRTQNQFRPPNTNQGQVYAPPNFQNSLQSFQNNQQRMNQIIKCMICGMAGHNHN